VFDIRKIAHLARLELNPDLEQELGRQLGDILSYVETLQAVDASSVEGYGLSEAPPVLREDEAQERGAPDGRVALGARTRDTMFLVPKVIGQGEA